MAVSRVKVWSAGEILYASDLNSEFNNILNNAFSLISPLTASLNAGGFKLSNYGGTDAPTSRTDAAVNSFTASGTGAVARTLSNKLRDVVSITDYLPFGYVTDGSVNYSTQVQAAIDAVSAAGGGDVLCPPGTYLLNVILKEGVFLVGSQWYGNLSGFASTTQVKFKAAATGIVIDTPSGATNSCGVIGINVEGLGAGTAVVGIRFRDVERGVVRQCSLNSFSDQGLLVESGCVVCTFEYIFAVNCLLDRTQSAKVGVIDIDGADHFISRIEATSSQSALSDSNAYLCAFVMRADNCFISDCIGEISDEGFHVTAGATLNGFVNCRADLNFGHGWQVIGTSSRYTGCLGLNNSQETTDTYDNFLATSSSGNNVFTGCYADSTTAKKAKYGYEDLFAGANNKNQYVNCLSLSAVTKQYSVNTNNGSSFAFPAGGQKTLTANSTTPDVTGYEFFQTGNSSGTTYTDFLNGVPGQKLTIFCGDANSTIQHNGATISTPTGANVTLVSGQIYFLFKYGSIWRMKT